MPAPSELLSRLLGDLPCMLAPQLAHIVPAAVLPEPCRALLAHDAHMTATLERFHGAPVAVEVVHRWHDAALYRREILLSVPNGRNVQYAVVNIALALCPQSAREAILAEREPLGRILQRLPTALRVEPVAFVRAALPARLAQRFAVTEGSPAYGRLVRIHHGPQCLIEGIELLAPAPVRVA